MVTLGFPAKSFEGKYSPVVSGVPPSMQEEPDCNDQFAARPSNPVPVPPEGETNKGSAFRLFWYVPE